MSAAGAALAVLLVVAGGLLLWAHAFINTEVHTQLAEQQISFPAAGSPALTGNPEIQKYVTPYAGQQVTDGQQAEVFADHYIKVHLTEVAGGKTYSQVSGQFLQMKPTDPGYAQVGQQRQTLFMGETLRGLLLNAYAFWKVGQIAMYAAIAAFIGAALLLTLSALGFRHAQKVPVEADVFVHDRPTSGVLVTP
ncbi:MAG: hypothetical protein JWP40_3864 [Blastococcus sp.]|jgi:hypothetical protein|nr:hypothetical protein [Blastococcus sp.]